MKGAYGRAKADIKPIRTSRYFFISTFAAEHVEFHAKYLKA
jgi:hypothetical protein